MPSKKLAMPMFRPLLHRATYILLILTLAILVGAAAAYLFWQLAFARELTTLTILMAIIVLLLGMFLWLLTKEDIDETSGNTRLATALRLSRHYRQKDKAWREALNAQALYEYYFRGAPIGIAALDGEGVIKSCNPAFRRLTGKPEKACLEKPITAMLVAEDHDKLPPMLERASKTPSHQAVEVGLDGISSKQVALYIGKLDASVAVERAQQQLVLYMLDISERKDLENQFVQSQKMQAVGQLAGGIAHDFNNLLTAMIGGCELLAERHPVGDPSYADINHIKSNAERAAGLVKHLLAFSRQQKLAPQVLDISETLADLSPLLRRWVTETVMLDVVHASDLGRVLMDKTQLEQVLMNLAINARDAMPQGGKLTITTYNYHQVQRRRHGNEIIQPGDYVTLEITDTGIGMPPEVSGRIFEPFFTTKAVGQGTGLGLSTVYGIVRQTGGHILVESTPGKGTTFIVHLPRYREKEAAADSTSPAPAAMVETAVDTGGAASIMLVEDEDPVRLFGARALRNKGYTVIEARSGEAALDILSANNPPSFDLLVTDVMMPGVDGPTLIRAVRQTYPEVKVMCISGYAEESIREKLNNLENIEFLAKPFTLAQLTARVRAVLDNT